jgi:hypothetical protein
MFLLEVFDFPPTLSITIQSILRRTIQKMAWFLYQVSERKFLLESQFNNRLPFALRFE